MNRRPYRRSILPAWSVGAVLAALLALATTGAGAAGAPARAASAASAAGGGMPGSAACREDAQRLCPNVQPGEGRVAACMREKRSELSTDCKRDLMKLRAERRGGGGRGASGATAN